MKQYIVQNEGKSFLFVIHGLHRFIIYEIINKPLHTSSSKNDLINNEPRMSWLEVIAKWLRKVKLVVRKGLATCQCHIT